MASNHLSEEALQGLVETGVVSGTDAAHLKECEACTARASALALAQRKMEELRGAPNPAPAAGPCEGIETWFRLAQEFVLEAEATALTEHAAGCAKCGPLLRQVLEDLQAEVDPQDPLVQGLPSSSAEGMRKSARRLASPARAERWGGGFKGWRLWLAAAAILAGATVGAKFLMQPGSARVRELLAEASRERRPFDLRFPGADYSSVAQQRGDDSVLPPALMEANASIARALASDSSDAQWLTASGEAKLLAWRYDAAIAALRKAGQATPGKARIENDLGAAYYERAQSRGAAADYRTAVDYFRKAIGLDPQEVEARFNLAVALEGAGDKTGAVNAWKDFLRIEPSGGWADEARSRLAAAMSNAR